MKARSAGIVALTLGALLCCGCGTDTAVSSPSRLYGAEGQVLLLEDITDIVDDPDLSNEQKREALHDLGISDEELIDALLTL